MTRPSHRVDVGAFDQDMGVVEVTITIWPRTPRELYEQELRRDAELAERVGLHEPIKCGTFKP